MVLLQRRLCCSSECNPRGRSASGLDFGFIEGNGLGSGDEGSVVEVYGHKMPLELCIIVL